LGQPFLGAALCAGVFVASVAAGGFDAPVGNFSGRRDHGHHVPPEEQWLGKLPTNSHYFYGVESSASTKALDWADNNLFVSSLQAKRQALLEEDEANSYQEFEMLNKKLREEDFRLMLLKVDGQVKEMRGKMPNVNDLANVAFDRETYAKKLPGVLPLLGYFDPLGLGTAIGVTEEKVKFYREAELKHGRLGTLAAFGIVVSENFHPLGGDQMNGVPATIHAFQNSELLLGTTLILATIALPDIKDVPLVSPTDKLKQTTELNGTRVGMLAATSMIAKEVTTSKCLFASLAFGTPEAAAVAAASESAVVSTALVEAV
jgi:hypothetical protein